VGQLRTHVQFRIKNEGYLTAENASKDSFFLGALCAFAQVTPTWLRLRRKLFAVNRCRLSLVFLRTLDDLVHFEDVGAGKDLGAGAVPVRFLKLRALRPGLK
jgi:hypothetical protein